MRSPARNPGHPSHTRDISDSWRRERPDLDLSNFLLSIYAMRLGRVLDDAYDRMIRARFGISGTDMRVLFALRRKGRPYARRATDLYRALLVTSGAVTKQLDRLAALGFLQRLPDPSHGAGVLAQLTSKGLKATDSAANILAKHSPIAAGMNSLSARDREALQRLVEHVLTTLETESLEPPPSRKAKVAKKGGKRKGRA